MKLLAMYGLIPSSESIRVRQTRFVASISHVPPDFVRFSADVQSIFKQTNLAVAEARRARSQAREGRGRRRPALEAPRALPRRYPSHYRADPCGDLLEPSVWRGF